MAGGEGDKRRKKGEEHTNKALAQGKKEKES